MTSVLISVRPQWCEKIANREKTLEIRKTKPKIPTPFTCYIYETKGATNTPWMDEDGHIDFHGRGQVIGEFVCDSYIGWGVNPLDGLYMIFPNELAAACLTGKDFEKYGNGKTLYGWHISALQIYDKPMELSEFSRFGFFGMGNSKYVCGNYRCKHFMPSGNYYEPPDCDIEGCTLTRPPQSWCYVEAHDEG